MSVAGIEWTFNPWRDRPRRTWAAAALLLATAALVASTGLPLLVKLGLALVVGASIGAALVPGRYRLDPDGVTLGDGPFARRREWSEIRRAVRSPEGVLLSPFARRHWLDAYRAFFLPLPPRGDGALAADVDRELARHGL